MTWKIYSSCYGSPVILQRYTFCEANDPFGRTDLNSVRRARQAKILGCLSLNTDIAVYCDSAIEINSSVSDLVEAFAISEATFGAFRHVSQECTYSEAETVLRLGLDVELTVLPQMRRYAETLPRNWGLFETGFCMFRTATCRAMCEAWWSEVEQGSHRDQLSLMPVLFKLSIPVFSFGRDLRKCEHLTFLKQEISERHSKKNRRISWL